VLTPTLTGCEPPAGTVPEEGVVEVIQEQGSGRAILTARLLWM
jgi:hypothetical protein